MSGLVQAAIGKDAKKAARAVIVALQNGILF
jgi:hypothetical protein